MGHVIRGIVGASVVVAATMACSSQGAPVVVAYGNTLTRPATDPASSNNAVSLDLNGDSIGDVAIAHTTYADAGHITSKSVNVLLPLNGASILYDGAKVIALHPGESAGPVGSYKTGNIDVLDSYPITSGNAAFFEPDVAFGVKIPVGGQDFFAWVGVQLAGPIAANPLSDRLIIHDYGYETAANTPVAAQAPEPASLAILAVAATPLLVRRRHSAI